LQFILFVFTKGMSGMKKISFLICLIGLFTVAFLIAPVTAALSFGSIAPTSGPVAGGTTVVITGAEFTYTTSVTFDSTAATSFTVNSDTQITASTPAHAAGAVNVIVTTSNGTATGSSVFTYIAPPTITSVTPSSAVNNGWQTIDIVGTGFSGSAVTLTKTGQSTVTGATTATADTATTLSRNFNLNGIAAGTWSVVILNTDGGTTTGTFTVNSATASTVTAISPTSGTVNTTVSTTITGTGFTPTSAKIRLYRSGNYIGGSVNSGGTTTQLTGTFDLNQATTGTYDVCVLPDGTETSKICSPTFTILSAAAVNGTIYIKSTPTSSKVFLGSTYQGYTPLTLDNITPGTYTVLVQRAGYNSYSESVKVTAGNTSYVTASLVLSPEETTVTTTVPTTTITTVKTTAKSTAKLPTPWPSATPTPASPVSILAILGAVGVGFVVMRKY
jgi:hypothetical protein